MVITYQDYTATADQVGPQDSVTKL